MLDSDMLHGLLEAYISGDVTARKCCSTSSRMEAIRAPRRFGQKASTGMPWRGNCRPRREAGAASHAAEALLSILALGDIARTSTGPVSVRQSNRMLP